MKFFRPENVPDTNKIHRNMKKFSLQFIPRQFHGSFKHFSIMAANQQHQRKTWSRAQGWIMILFFGPPQTPSSQLVPPRPLQIHQDNRAAPLHKRTGTTNTSQRTHVPRQRNPGTGRYRATAEYDKTGHSHIKGSSGSCSRCFVPQHVSVPSLCCHQMPLKPAKKSTPGTWKRFFTS